MSLMMKMSGKPTGQDKEMEYSKVQDNQHWKSRRNLL